MEAYQQRVISERDQLEEKCNGLYAFLHGEQVKSVDPKARGLLQTQYYAMQVYKRILDQRIENF